MKHKILILLIVLTIQPWLVLSRINSNQPKTVHIKSYSEKYITIDQQQTGQLTANADKAGKNESFIMTELAEGKVCFMAGNSKYIAADADSGQLLAGSPVIADREKFTIVKISEDWIAIKAYNGKFVSVSIDGKFILVAGQNLVKEQELFKLIII